MSTTRKTMKVLMIGVLLVQDAVVLYMLVLLSYVGDVYVVFCWLVDHRLLSYKRFGRL